MLERLNNIQRSCQLSAEMIKAHTASGLYTAGCEHGLYQLERLEDLTRLCKSEAVNLDFATANLLNLLETLDSALSACYQSCLDPEQWTALNKAIKATGSIELLAQRMRTEVLPGD